MMENQMFILLALLGCNSMPEEKSPAVTTPPSDEETAPTEVSPTWCPGLASTSKASGAGPDSNPGVTRIQPQQFLEALPKSWNRSQEWTVAEGDAGHASGQASAVLSKGGVLIRFAAYDLIRVCTAKPGMGSALQQQAMHLEDGAERLEIEGAPFFGVSGRHKDNRWLTFWIEDRCQIHLEQALSAKAVSEESLMELARNLDSSHLKTLCAAR
jgi:hypothetical protein